MKEFRVDLHLHTCLSPCGSLEMSPQRIVETALERGLDAIAVTDHNSTLQCPEILALGEERGLMVFAGAEVTTREEAHCVALFGFEHHRHAVLLIQIMAAGTEVLFGSQYLTGHAFPFAETAFA